MQIFTKIALLDCSEPLAFFVLLEKIENLQSYPKEG